MTDGDDAVSDDSQKVIDDGDHGDSIPAVFVNRFYLRTGPVVSRLSLGERIDPNEPTHWRMVASIATADLKALVDLINSLLKGPEGGADTPGTRDGQ